MKNLVIAIQSSVITTIVYALLVPIFFEMENNAFGDREYIVDEDANNKVMYSQQIIDTKCKSPCPSSAEMCIAMCA
ncbi:MAG TPA: hypothetical protein VJU85_02850 [Nitrososphaeraceae archaeon]|nr:hypothetical protein [Nitrososphaeraceae archaeon]